MKKIIKEFYISSDWREFTSEEECRKYELEKQEKIIERQIYLYSPKWYVYEVLVREGEVFDEENEKLLWKLKYLLNEISLKIRLNKETWEYKILEVEWKKVLNGNLENNE